MDRPDTFSHDTDYGDLRTYGEVELPVPANFGSLSTEDWRQLSGKPATARRPKGPKLYHGARAGTLDEERKRAQEVIGIAKQAMIETFDDVRFGRRIEVPKLVPIVTAIAASIERNPHAIPSMTRLKLRSEYTYLHSVAVCGLMIGLGRELRLDAATIEMGGMAGLLHDIGKAAVSPTLIDKPGPLTDDEFDIVKLHPVRGFELLSDAEGIPDPVRHAVLHHHERMDGRGYPSRRPAGELSMLVRMATICDVYDAVTSSRAYKDSWSPGAAIEWMRSTEGHFDPLILHSFVKMLGAFPPGTLVRLRSDRLAVVIDERDDDPLNPMVVAFHCALFDRPLTQKRLSSAHDPILAVEAPSQWNLTDWSALREELMGRPPMALDHDRQRASDGDPQDETRSAA